MNPAQSLDHNGELKARQSSSNAIIPRPLKATSGKSGYHIPKRILPLPQQRQINEEKDEKNAEIFLGGEKNHLWSNYI